MHEFKKPKEKLPFGRYAFSIPPENIQLRDPSRPSPVLDRSAQDRLGRELRAMYSDLERQPVPQQILDLLTKMKTPKG